MKIVDPEDVRDVRSLASGCIEAARRFRAASVRVVPTTRLRQMVTLDDGRRVGWYVEACGAQMFIDEADVVVATDDKMLIVREYGVNGLSFGVSSIVVYLQE